MTIKCHYLGPALGSFLYGLGGFTLPFVVVGSIGVAVATSFVFVMDNVQTDSEIAKNKKTLTLAQFLSSNFWLVFLVSKDNLWNDP